MTPATSTTHTDSISLADSFERYLQDKGKGRGGDGGNYRRNAARELEQFGRWAVATAVGAGGRESYQMMSTATQPSKILMNECSGDTPGFSAVTAHSSKTPYTRIITTSLRGVVGARTKGI
jgi:hypothetical protein